MKDTDRSAYTLFELIAVLTVSGIIFMVVMGSWNSWSVVHACNGAAAIVKSEIRQARALAMAKNRYVKMELSSYTTNSVQYTSSCQMFLCTNDTGNVESLLNQTDSDKLQLTPASPIQNLSNHIRLSSFTDSTSEKPEAILFFRPDGSIKNSDNTQYHYIKINSRRLFNEKSLSRLLHIDLATGIVKIIREEDL